MNFESGEYGSLGGTTIESSDLTAVTLVLHEVGECVTDEFGDDDDNCSFLVEPIDPVAVHSPMSLRGMPHRGEQIEF
jgi:hypothetical protein